MLFSLLNWRLAVPLPNCFTKNELFFLTISHISCPGTVAISSALFFFFFFPCTCNTRDPKSLCSIFETKINRYWERERERDRETCYIYGFGWELPKRGRTGVVDREDVWGAGVGEFMIYLYWNPRFCFFRVLDLLKCLLLFWASVILIWIFSFWTFPFY